MTVTVQQYSEWIKKLPDERKVRYTCQLLTSGFTASAEILEPVTMVYTHTHADLPAPADRAQIEAEFAEELAKTETQESNDAAMGRHRLAS